MKHLKLFENFNDSLFHKVEDPRIELRKRGILPIIQHANTIRGIVTKTIGAKFESKSVKDSIGSCFFIGSDEFEFKIRRMDDEYYLVSYWSFKMYDTEDEPHFIRVEHYIADDLDGLEECLVYLLNKPIDKSFTFIDDEDYDYDDDDDDDDDDLDNFDY